MPSIALTQCPKVGSQTPTHGVIRNDHTLLFPFLTTWTIGIWVDCYLNAEDQAAGGNPLSSYMVTLNKEAIVAADAPSAAGVFQAVLPAGPQSLQSISDGINAASDALLYTVLAWHITNTPDTDPQYSALQALVGVMS